MEGTVRENATQKQAVLHAHIPAAAGKAYLSEYSLLISALCT